MIENVPNFITKYKGKIFNTAVEIIENIGKDDEGNGEGIYEVVKPNKLLMLCIMVSHKQEEE